MSFDYQKVRIVAVSQPTISECENPEQLIAYIARVSNPSNQANHLTAPKLLQYCAKHAHWSVFETISVTMEIETTRDIGRQILRHRSFSFQEFSQRYADPTKDLSFVNREARLQDIKNRQNSIETADEILKAQFDACQQQIIMQAKAMYDWAIQNGIAKEQARALLPEGLTMSRMYMHGTLRSWIHYCDLRSKNGTQKEHMDIAVKAWSLISEKFPSIKEVIDNEYNSN